jgi:hypothetical protein
MAAPYAGQFVMPYRFAGEVAVVTVTGLPRAAINS